MLNAFPEIEKCEDESRHNAQIKYSDEWSGKMAFSVKLSSFEVLQAFLFPTDGQWEREESFNAVRESH